MRSENMRRVIISIDYETEVTYNVNVECAPST